MRLPQNTSYTPVVRKEPRHFDEIDVQLMKKGQRMFKYYSQPHRNPWPITEKRRQQAEDYTVGLRLLRADWDRAHRAFLISELNNQSVTDVPTLFRSFIPCRGVFIRNVILRFRIWRAKRYYRKFEDWTFKEKNHAKRHHGLLQLVRLVGRRDRLF